MEHIKGIHTYILKEKCNEYEELVKNLRKGFDDKIQELIIKNDEIKSINHCKMNKTLKLLQSSKFNQLSKSEIFQEISFLLMKIKSLNSQYSLNGKDNIWILKPAG